MANDIDKTIEEIVDICGEAAVKVCKAMEMMSELCPWNNIPGPYFFLGSDCAETQMRELIKREIEKHPGYVKNIIHGR